MPEQSEVTQSETQTPTFKVCQMCAVKWPESHWPMLEAGSPKSPEGHWILASCPQCALLLWHTWAEANKWDIITGKKTTKYITCNCGTNWHPSFQNMFSVAGYAKAKLYLPSCPTCKPTSWKDWGIANSWDVLAGKKIQKAKIPKDPDPTPCACNRCKNN